MTTRLAHFSDVHVTSAPLSERWSAILGKRIAGTGNYYVGGRRHLFRGSDARLEALLADIDGQGVDHALCTGDVTQMSYPSEFARCAELFGERVRRPERWSVIPGNHDRYTREAAHERRFERFFGAISAPSGRYPWVKHVDDRVTLVMIDVTRPTGLVDSSGLCGSEQLQVLSEVLSGDALRGRFVVVALHYGLLRADGRPDRPRHGVRDADQLLRLLDGERSRVHLVLHGHLHEAFLLDRPNYQILCAGSATDLAHGGSYHVIEVGEGAARAHRRSWDPSTGGYALAETLELAPWRA